MARNKFIQSQGATCTNWLNSWSFVNHEEKFIIFGAWDVLTEPDRCLILNSDWEKNNGRRQAGYSQAKVHMALIEEHGYKLKTFPMIISKQSLDESGNGPAKIKEIIEELTDMELHKDGNHWYAVGPHKPEYSAKPDNSEASDIFDIFNSDIEQTEKESLVMSRLGQGKFRQNVIDVWGIGEQCALTGVNIREMLIASHILPWSKCTDNNQRLDGANGILLCAHVDKLFDSHLITFEKKRMRYMIKTARNLDLKLLKSIGIEIGLELPVGRMPPKFQRRFDEYLVQHNRSFELSNKQ